MHLRALRDLATSAVDDASQPEVLRVPLVSRLESWGSWSQEARAMAATWRAIRGEDFSIAQLRILGVVALTPIGDEFTPVGALCPTCGEMFVTVPERISATT